MNKNNKKYDAVVFDVDSTLVSFEGLDWIADYKNKGHSIKNLTSKSMEGNLDFNEAMVRKMKIIAPSYKDLEKLGDVYSKNISKGAEKVINALHSLGKEVWILTGNFNPAVEILAKRLGISKERIICNKIFHSPKGDYLGFDEGSLLSKNGGKGVMIKKVSNGTSKNVVYVGDSATDLETKGHVNLFVGFGGVVEREIVKRESDIYLPGPSMYPLLEVVLTEKELEKIKRE